MSNEPYDWEREALAARAAANEGRWEAVQQYYDERAARLREPVMAQSPAVLVATLDREIERKILVAQTALTSVLREIAPARRALSMLKSTLTGRRASRQLVDRSA